jgi:ArsR family transcriptional regulator
MTELEQKLYEKQADLFKALAHPLRLSIIAFLKDGERCVCEIVENVPAERSNISRHLALMTSAGVLESRKEGLRVYYKLKRECVLSFLDCVNECILAEIKQDTELIALL